MCFKYFVYGDFSGVVGLGESYRGARLFHPFITLGVFIMFARPRTIWRLLFVSMCGIPILLFCNYIRMLCWALVTIYFKAGVVSMWPRLISSAIYFIIAYGLWILACNIKLNLFVEVDEEEEIDEDK